jgi:hypothetical protein
MDMICYMHEGTPYGHLKVNQKVILPPNLARMCGLTVEETEGFLAELHDAGVYETDETGCICSRRMIRDEHLRNVRAAGGKKGGNPSLKAGKVNLKDNLKVGNEVKQKPTPSSSSSSSYILKRKPSLEEVIAAGDKAGFTPQECTDFFNECESRAECPQGGWTLWNGEPMNMERWQNALARFASWDRQRKAKPSNGKRQTVAANNGRKWQL